MSDTKRIYVVNERGSFLKDHVHYTAGMKVELTNEEAANLESHLVVNLGSVEVNLKKITQLTNENESLIAENEELRAKLKDLEKVISALEKQKTELKKK